jgi:hypothetical protein
LMRRAMGASKGSTRSAGACEAPDEGKWAGAGAKTLKHGAWPAIARQAQPGRGAKTRTVQREDKKSHPSHG